ncbi:MAG: hypothetical protein JW812_01995 [Alphaproteobacteria bacterium]|nr:hypothetical protein [Alphaproteobacteria bacterium]MBN2779693.1 hypothetical protein [Alphaproteobacteria bacterium]
MRRLFLFLSIMVSVSISVQALPLHLTTHLRNVTPQDCERVIAKIAMTESKDPDLKNQLDEVPQCITFFTERLTRESFRDKDYRKGCQDLLPDFCQQNRYLSLQTIVEKYKTNNLKLIGSMGLGFMYGKTAVSEAKKLADRFKKSTGDKVEATKSQGENVYEENLKIKEECLARGPQDCKLTWKLKDDTCVDETKKSKVKCECEPATWTDDYDPDTKQCGKLKAECLANNGATQIPLTAGPNFADYVRLHNTGRATNKDLHIMEWMYDEANTSHGINGCHIKQCAKGYMKDEYDLECLEDDGTNCKANNDLGDTAALFPPIPSSLTKAKLNAVAFDYRAGSSYGWGGCFISNCKPGFEPNENKTNCIPVVVEYPNINPPTNECAAFDAPPNGFGRASIVGHIFGTPVASPCRLICNEDRVALDADDPAKKKCETAATNCTNIFTQGGKRGKNIIGWEYDATASDPKCQPLCQGKTKLNPEILEDIATAKETPIDEFCVDPKTETEEEEEEEKENVIVVNQAEKDLCALKINRFVSYTIKKIVSGQLGGLDGEAEGCVAWGYNINNIILETFTDMDSSKFPERNIIEMFCQDSPMVESIFSSEVWARLTEIKTPTSTVSEIWDNWIKDEWKTTLKSSMYSKMGETGAYNLFLQQENPKTQLIDIDKFKYLFETNNSVRTQDIEAVIKEYPDYFNNLPKGKWQTLDCP